jgi:hypothetical protein
MQTIDEINALIDKFGGCTLYQNCKGFWKNESNKTVIDNITVLEIYTSAKDFKKHGDFFRRVLIQIKQKFKQTCIAYTINNKISFL